MPEIILPDLSQTEDTDCPTYANYRPEMAEYHRERREYVKQLGKELNVPPNRHTRLKLSARHMLMLNWAVAGVANKDIAARFEMGEVAVTHIINSPLFQKALRERQKEIADGLDTETFSTVAEAKKLMEEEAFNAAERLVKLSQSSEAKIALAATNSLLDRCFGTESKKQDAGPPIQLSITQIEKLQMVIEESRRTA